MLKKIFLLQKILILSFFLILISLSSSFSDDREKKLNNLFNKLKLSQNSIAAAKIEEKIWKIWTSHPEDEKLTIMLAKGSILMSKNNYDDAYLIFSKVIELDPDWSEGWNKRATVLYLMGNYQLSQNDIDKVLHLEKRHFGALSGQGLVQLALNNYQNAINSYKMVETIYPTMISPKLMIPKLKELIKKNSI